MKKHIIIGILFLLCNVCNAQTKVHSLISLKKSIKNCNGLVSKKPYLVQWKGKIAKNPEFENTSCDKLYEKECFYLEKPNAKIGYYFSDFSVENNYLFEIGLSKKDFEKSLEFLKTKTTKNEHGIYFFQKNAIKMDSSDYSIRVIDEEDFCCMFCFDICRPKVDPNNYSEGDEVAMASPEPDDNDTKKESNLNQIFTAVEVQPEFSINGTKGMYKFIDDNIKLPTSAKKANITGKVFVKFVIEKNGSIGLVEVLKGIGYGCDEEAIRLVKSFPKWNPGKQNCSVVRCFYTMPINFK